MIIIKEFANRKLHQVATVERFVSMVILAFIYCYGSLSLSSFNFSTKVCCIEDELCIYEHFK